MPQAPQGSGAGCAPNEQRELSVGRGRFGHCSLNRLGDSDEIPEAARKFLIFPEIFRIPGRKTDIELTSTVRAAVGGIRVMHSRHSSRPPRKVETKQAGQEARK